MFFIKLRQVVPTKTFLQKSVLGHRSVREWKTRLRGQLRQVSLNQGKIAKKVLKLPPPLLYLEKRAESGYPASVWRLKNRLKDLFNPIRLGQVTILMTSSQIEPLDHSKEIFIHYVKFSFLLKRSLSHKGTNTLSNCLKLCVRENRIVKEQYSNSRPCPIQVYCITLCKSKFFN